MRMTPKFLVGFLAVSAVLAGAVGVNLTGLFSLEFEGTLPNEQFEGQEFKSVAPANEPCVFKGTINVIEAASAGLGGSVQVTLVSGPDACPDEMTADLAQVSVDGDMVFVTLQGDDDLGSVNAEGTIQEEGRWVSGTYQVDQGPFAGIMDEWEAHMFPSSEIPLLSGSAILMLAGLLGLTAIYLQTRRKRA